MARRARKRAEYLHIILRGVGKQIIFEDDADRRVFLSILRKYRDEQEIVVAAYCLMDNHAHLLIHDYNGRVSLFMKKLGVSYAMYFNRRYNRVGHLFQNRYKSEIVVGDFHYLRVYRYILNNPAKAGICSAANYRWSSYHEYGRAGLTDSSFVSGIIGDKSELDSFLSISDDLECMEDTLPIHNDEWALAVIKNELHFDNAFVVKALPRNERNEVLAKMKKKGMSVRQIERLTGVNRGVITNAR